MWASRPFHHDNDMPIDLRKKVVLEREERRESSLSPSRTAFVPKDQREGWNRAPAALPLGNLHPFMSEKYRVKCSLVSEEGKSGGGKGTLETAIRKLHHNRQLKVTEPSKEERCRSTDIALESSEKDPSLDGKRSSSCPNLTVIKPKPSPIKPKSSFIQRSSGYISDTTSQPNNLSVTSTTFHQDHDEHSNSQPKCGAKKRKSFIPVYGDRGPPRPLTPEEDYFPHHDHKRPWSVVKNNDYFSQRPRSPFDQEEYYPHSEKRPRSPEYYSHQRPQSPGEPEEYFSHPEVLLRRQLQQHSPSPYLVHVYDYYQQLVQRMREHSSPGMRLPPPVSPPSGDDESQMDGQRKRPCRALTGKHVRQGTGASISTLLTLRQKIQERQKAKEHEPRTGLIGNNNRNGSPKKNKANQKIKTKSPMQVQKC